MSVRHVRQFQNFKISKFTYEAKLTIDFKIKRPYFQP